MAKNKNKNKNIYSITTGRGPKRSSGKSWYDFEELLKNNFYIDKMLIGFIILVFAIAMIKALWKFAT